MEKPGFKNDTVDKVCLLFTSSCKTVSFVEDLMATGGKVIAAPSRQSQHHQTYLGFLDTPQVRPCIYGPWTTNGLLVHRDTNVSSWHYQTLLSHYHGNLKAPSVHRKCCNSASSMYRMSLWGPVFSLFLLNLSLKHFHLKAVTDIQWFREDVSLTLGSGFNIREFYLSRYWSITNSETQPWVNSLGVYRQEKKKPTQNESD